MSDQNNLIAVDGHIIERLPNSDFLVELDNQCQIQAHLSGKLRWHYFRHCC